MTTESPTMSHVTFQDRVRAVPARIRFVAFSRVQFAGVSRPLVLTRRSGKFIRHSPMVWIYEGYGATAADAERDLRRRVDEDA